LCHFRPFRISSAILRGSIVIAICLFVVGYASAQTLRSITVSPGSGRIPVGLTQQFTATGVYSDGSTRNLSSTVSWSSSNGNVASVSRTGLASARSVGSTTITAASGAIRGAASLTVSSGNVTTISVTPLATTVAVQGTVQFTATGLFDDGSTYDLTNYFTWSSSSKSIATISATALATGVAGGTTTITASYAGTTYGSSSLTVTAPVSLRSIAVTPVTASLPPGSTLQYTATGTYSDGSTANITTSVSWSSSATTVATINSAGLVSAIRSGTTTIKATSAGISGSTSLTVTAAITSISISPSAASVALGLTQQFKATAHYSNGTTSDVTALATWTSSVPAVAGISNNTGSQGLATSVAAGSSIIHAAYQGITSGAAQLTVTGAALVSIAVSPQTASIALGTSQQFIATGTYTDGSTKVITTSVSWTSSAPAVATIGSSGVAVSSGVGTTTVGASSGSISGSAALSVTPAALASISVTPQNLVLPKGGNQQFTATGLYTDGTTQNITSSVQWTSSNPGIASTSVSGMAQAIATGTVQVTASAGAGISGQSSMTVSPAALVSIAVTPSNTSVARGTKQQFAATGTYTDGSTQDLTGSVLWSSSDTGIATIDSSGEATGVGGGSATITAASGSITGSTVLTVIPSALVSIAVTPAIPSVPLGETRQFTATGTFADGSIQDLTASVSWSSSNPSVATIGMSSPTRGLAQTLATGTTTIAASSAGVSGTTVLTVSPAVITSIEVTPAPLSLAKGTTQQLAAIATYSDDTTKDISASAAWSSSDSSIATVSATGDVTANKVGSATLTAASGGVVGTENVQVNPAVLVSIAVSPDSASIPLGTTQQFTAAGTYSDASTQDVTASVHWASSDSTVATVSVAQATAGLATSTGTGTATISATSGTVSDAANFTVTPAVLVSIAITPSAPSIALGQSQQFTATGTYTDQSTKNITTNVTWSTSNALVAVVSNTTGSKGLAASSGQGTATIGAAMGSVAATTTLTVAALPAPTGLTALASGNQIALHWNSVGGATSYQVLRATVSGGPYSPLGVVNTNNYTDMGLAAGSTYYYVVSAINSTTQSSISAEASATTPVAPVLVSLSISPLNPSVVQGGTQQFAATAIYSDSSTIDVTTAATWSSSNIAVATIGASGLAATLSQGSTTIGAIYGGHSATTTLVSQSPCLSFFPVDVFLSMNGASPGTKVTLANLAASTEVAANYSGWGVASAAQTFGASRVAMPAGISINGGSAHNCGFATQALVHNAAASFSTSQMYFPSKATNVTTSGWVVGLPPNQGTSGAYFDLVLNVGGITPYTATLQLDSGTNDPACTGYCLEIEGSGGPTIHSMGNTAVTPGSTIFFSMNTNWTTTGSCMNQAVTSASWASSTATVTVGNNVINTGSTVTVAGIIPAGYNGTYKVKSATSRTISYALTTNPGTYASGGTAVLPAPCTRGNVYTTSGTTFTQVGPTMAVSMGGTDKLGTVYLGNDEYGAYAGSYSLQNIMVDYTNHIWPNLPH
jgi:uncharacterized protein YjdB